MAATISQYAALAEWIYARDPADQALTVADIGAGTVVDPDILAPFLDPTATGLTHSGDRSYSERGFVGTIIQQGTGDNATYIVVLRGSDWGSADFTQLLGAVAGTVYQNGDGTYKIDTPDWQQNVLLGLGVDPNLTQADDAMALARAALALANGDASLGVRS